ncbi:MAG: VWA domain-containing protein [Chloroflexi bacterium]|nr:MAG: VWA domain-containing protein [Chloroflexota bacterium]
MSTSNSGHLLQNLLLFGRLLRALGMDINPGRIIDLVNALQFVEIGRKSDFYYTTRSLLVHQHEDLPLFDQAFELFWRKPDGTSIPFGLMKRPFPTPTSPQFTPPNLPQPNDNNLAQLIIKATHTYSQREILRHKDFSELTADEAKSLKQFMAELVWELGLRRTRRHKGGNGNHLDLRRTFRQTLRTGGELLEWPRRTPKFKPRPLIILADISGSMEPYTRLLLQFIYSLAAGLTQNVEAFVFSTHLTHITRQLHSRELDRALADISRQVTDWSGGTRIGAALKTFNYDWGRRVLGRGAVVLLISDGWDRGDPDLLKREIGRLHRSCHRLIWLNPLLGSPNYEPLTRGMQTALPHIDDFLPVHNLASLEDLAEHLAGLVGNKQRQRQRQKKETCAISSVRGINS